MKRSVDRRASNVKRCRPGASSSADRRQLLHAAQPGSTLVRLENVNHVLKSIASTDLPAQMETYRDPSMPLATSVVPAIAGWIEDLAR
jgi:hypothetical protein